VDLPPQPSQVMTLGGKVLAPNLTEEQQQALGAWADAHGEDLLLVNADDVAFADTGTVLIVTWPGAMPRGEDVERWLDALRPLARALERGQR